MSDSAASNVPAHYPVPGWVPLSYGADGAPDGTDGRPARRLDRREFVKGWLLIVLLLAGATVVNGLTALADNRHAAPWEPWVWEATSSVMLVLLAWLPGVATVAAQSGHPKGGASFWGRLLAIHAGAVLVFSAVHVVGMLALRQGLYAAAGAAYRTGPFADRFVYEFRKDLLTYAIFAALFWVARRSRAHRGAPTSAETFDIRDGARLIRTSVADIVAARSAGNYVEFVLAGGRRPLMRTTLAAVQAELERSGFVRTHRSWLVNPARLTGLRRQGSGDWTVELGEATAPVSRRYPDALVQLKRQG